MRLNFLGWKIRSKLKSAEERVANSNRDFFWVDKKRLCTQLAKAEIDLKQAKVIIKERTLK